MNTKTTLFVVLIAIALAVYFFTVETKTTTTLEKEQQLAQQGQAVGERLLSGERMPLNKVKTIRLSEPGQKPVVIERDGEDFQQVEPVVYKLQTWDAQTFIDSAGALRYTSKFTPTQRDVSLEALGLAPPQATLTYEGEGFEPVTLTLGKRAGSGRAYVTLGEPGESSTVYVVDDALHTAALDKPVRSMRDPAIASFTPGKARRIELQHDDQTIKLAFADARWAISKPVPGRAATQKVNQLVQAVAIARAGEFVADNPENLAAYGLDQPSTVLKIDVVDAEAGADTDAADQAEKTITHVLKIGSPTDLSRGKFFAMYDDTPTVFTLTKADVDKLNVTADDLRDPALTPTPRSDVREVTLAKPDQPDVHMIKSPAWSFGDPKPTYGLDAGVMNDLLDAIYNTKATSFVDLSNKKLKAPIATIRMQVLAKSEPETLAIHEHDKGRLLVVRGGESVGAVVPIEALKLAMEPAIAFRDRTVLDLATDQIAAIDLLRSGKYPAEYHLKRGPAPEGDDKPGPWQFAGHDEAAVKSLINQLAPVRAAKWMREPMMSIPEGAALTITTTDGKTHQLSVHPGAPGMASVEGIKSQFQPTPELVAATEAELRDKLVFDVAADQIAKVSIGKHVIERDEAGKYTMQGEGRMVEQVVAGIWDQLAKLSADHFVDTGYASGDPTTTLSITTRDGKTHTLKLWTGSSQTPVAQFDNTSFTVAPDVAAALVASPAQSSTKDAAK
ncbi:DUF4340 domain-containing protein [Planctomycetales bacterium ZRK34]|nr:DUF4340 domain-containing protein [Planctomycetales bacterium ZRK34]